MEQRLCWVCCKPLTYFALGACGHNDMCVVCALRLRYLMQNTLCPICKVELPTLVITSSYSRRPDDMTNTIPGEAGLFYDSAECKAIEESLLGFSCWLKGCPKKKKGANFTALKNHIEGFHKLKFCPICVKSRIAFPSEQHLYKFEDLARHIDNGEGDDIPPHPPCLVRPKQFCNERYFDEEELRRHLQGNHFSCGLCDSLDIFYVNYDKLVKSSQKQHFIKTHFMCPDQNCQANRFVVFKTAFGLQDHNVIPT